MGVQFSLSAFNIDGKVVGFVTTIQNVYCPVCKEKANRNKLLFKKTPETKGIVFILCRGCREEIQLDLDKEPVSRLSDK
ncbi:MAG: hypothetical protein KBT03_00935 [Bacteroidales bacterium]|nr:hypothetical protein [Candidatus Scybalousia scybalohippi]